MSSSKYVEDLKKLERSKSATFSLEGVIAARTPEAGQRTHDAIQHICEVIIEAYRCANDSSNTIQQKQEAIFAVARLSPDLDALVQFTQDEAAHCKYAQAAQMNKIAQHVASQVNMLKSDFAMLRTKLEVFNQVFDVMLAVLEQMTDFFKQGHGAEVMHVIDQGKNAYAECNNLLHIEVPSLLVPQGKLVKDRAEDFLKKCENLVRIQEGANQSLQDKIENCGVLMKGSIPEFIVKSRDHLVKMGQPSHAGCKQAQQAAYNSVISCLDEINRVLDRIKVKYINAFDEDPLKARKELDDLDKAAGALFNNLAKLKIPARADDPGVLAAAEALPVLTKSTLGAMASAGAPQELQREVVAAVKKARDGDIPQYFESVQEMENILSRIPTEPEFSISIAPLVTIADDGPKDMLEAAKAMCASLKSLNLVLDF